MIPFKVGNSSNKFDIRNFQRDPNCVGAYIPQIWGGADQLARRNLLLNTATLATQNVTTLGLSYTLYLKGTGSVTLSGAATGTLNGTGAGNRVSLQFTPTAGTLTLTVSGSVTEGHLTRTATTDHSYQAVTDWTTEVFQYNAQRQLPWLRRNRLVNTENINTATFTKSGATTPSNTTLIEDSSVSATHHLYYDITSCIEVGSQFGVRFSAKPNGRNFVWFGSNSAIGLGTVTYIDLVNGSVTTLGAGFTVHSITAGADWYWDIEFSATPTAAGASNIFIGIATADGVRTYNGDGSSGINLTKLQFSNGRCSYQPILSDWDTTYTANAIAAGYPIALWQDSAGTKAVNADNQAIGAMRDAKYKSGYVFVDQFNFYVSNAALQASWTSVFGTPTVTLDGEVMRLTNGSGNSGVKKDIPVTVGKTYLVSGALVGGTSSAARIRAGTVANDSLYLNYQSSSTTGQGGAFFTATESTVRISLYTNNAGAGVYSLFDNIVVQEIPGYTAIQSTAANQPKWRLDSNGEPCIERDLVNDALPITLPTVLSDAQLGPELVTNGTFTTDTTGWTSGNSTLSVDSGRLKVTNSTTAFGLAYQALSTEIGATYLFTVNFTAGTASTFIAKFGTSINGIQNYNSGNASLTYFTAFFVATATTTYLTFNVGVNTDTYYIFLDNISVKKITGTNVVYTAEGNVTLKDSGLILSGSYAPITPAVDYGRIIMAGPSQYDAKIIKYLDGKRGRAYSLGPELVTNGGFDNGTGWTTGTGWSIGSGVATASSATGILYSTVSGMVAGKTIELSVTVTGSMYVQLRLCGVSVGYFTFAVGTTSRIVTLSGASSLLEFVGLGELTTGTVDNVSVREVILS